MNDNSNNNTTRSTYEAQLAEVGGNPLTKRTVIGWFYSRDPGLLGYGSNEEYAEATEAFAGALPDAIGTAATLPARITECMRCAGLGASTYYTEELRRHGANGAWRPLSWLELERLHEIQVSP